MNKRVRPRGLPEVHASGETAGQEITGEYTEVHTPGVHVPHPPFKGGNGPEIEFGYSDADWEARLQAAVAETLRMRAARRDERAEFKRRRDWGLTQRHAQKLARNRAETLATQQKPGGHTMSQHNPFDNGDTTPPPADTTIVIEVGDLTGGECQQLHAILNRAAAAPSITDNVAVLLRRAAAGAYLAIPEPLRQAEMRRRLDAALTPDGRVRETPNG